MLSTDEYASPIRAMRKHIGLTQGGLAEILGVSMGTVSRWETGVNRIPKPEHLLIRLLYLGALGEEITHAMIMREAGMPQLELDLRKPK